MVTVWLLWVTFCGVGDGLLLVYWFLKGLYGFRVWFILVGLGFIWDGNRLLVVAVCWVVWLLLAWVWVLVGFVGIGLVVLVAMVMVWV